MDSDLETRLTKYLHKWSSSRLYVGDQYEFRANIQLHPISTKIHFNSFSLYGKLYPLPTSQGCFVYSFPTALLRGMSAGSDTDTWMDGATYLNTMQCRLFVYDNLGRLMPLGCVYIKVSTTRTFLVVTKDAFLSSVTGGLSSVNNLFLTFWVNPHPENPVSVKTFYPKVDTRTQNWSTDNKSALAAIYSSTDNEHSFTSVLVNGVSIAPKDVTLGSKDYIDIITETDIFCKFDVTIDDNVTGYESDLYKDYREILHMPKIYNPNSYVLTHDLIDVFIKDPDSGKSLYQSRYDYRSIRQITHQDYSIDRTDADSLRDALHASNVVATVVVRNPVRHRTLGGDSNYISDLYRNDDTTIVSLLRNSYISGMDFWSAKILEASKYTSLLFTNTVKTEPSSTGSSATLSDYIDALGYYNTMAVLDGGVEVGVWDSSTLVAKAPAILHGRDLLPYVFVNGRKVLQSNLHSNRVGSNKVELGIKDSSLTAGDKISVLLKDKTSVPVETITISKDNTTYTPTHDNYSIYQIVDGVYKPITRSTTTYRTDIVNGNTELTFYVPLYGSTLYVFYDNMSCSGAISLDSAINERKALIYRLKGSDGHPLLKYETLDVYLNGYWCINGIDYCIYPDSEDSVITLAITNRNFLDIDHSGNVLEWFSYGDKTINDDFDYIIDNKLRHEEVPYLFEKNVSEVYSEGLYITDLINEGSYIATIGQNQASVGEHILRFPYILYNSIPTDNKDKDDAKRVAITNYFKTTKPNIPEQVILNSQHQVYSPWLQYLIISLINGDITGVNDPDIVSFIKQFPSVNGLKEHDPTLYRTGRMNRDYLAIAAAYTLELPDTPVQIRAIIQKLISLTLVRDMSSLGVTAV